MRISPIRWLGKNLSTLLLAFVLAVVVWVSAVVAADPNEERVYPRAVELEVIGKDDSLLQLENIPSQARITLNAPTSIWNQLNLNPDYVRAWIDLSGLGAGEHTVPVKTQISLNPVRVVKVEPETVTVRLEEALTKEFAVQLTVTGDPALGYRVGIPTLDPEKVNVSGPVSFVEQVAQAMISIDISGENESVRRNVPVQLLDSAGDLVTGVSVTPSNISVVQPVNLLGGYRNVVVKVQTSGEVADGYWLTNISVTPPNVTVFATDPQLVNQLPGFVETNPIDLSGLSDDIDIRATLNLPDGVELVGEESVLVRLSIAAREGTLPITFPLVVVGLPPELGATFAPDTVDVLLAGPLPILNNLNPAGIRVAVNLTGMEVGSFQVEPVVDLLPNQVRVVYILPETVEVTISEAPTPTPTSEITDLEANLENISTETPQATPSPTVTPTPSPTATLTPSPTITPTPQQ